MHANPIRAAELRAVGPPSNTVGWAKFVWPNLKIALSAGSGPFSSAVPKVGLLGLIFGIVLISNYQVRHLLGPNVIFQTPGYGCSECFIGVTYHQEDLNRFKVLLDDAFIEYLDVTSEEVANKLCAAVRPFHRVAFER